MPQKKKSRKMAPPCRPPHSESGLSPECAKRIAGVLQQIFQPARAPRVAALLLDLFRTAERKPCLSSCFVRRYAAPNQLRSMLLEMKAQFLFELRFHLRSSR